MGREASASPGYDIMAYVTTSKERVLGGKPLTLLAVDEKEQKTMAQDVANALKADIARLTCGDYMIVRL